MDKDMMKIKTGNKSHSDIQLSRLSDMIRQTGDEWSIWRRVVPQDRAV